MGAAVSGQLLPGLVLGLLAAKQLEGLGAVLLGVEYRARHVDRALVLEGEDDRVAGPGVYLDDLRPQLVLHGEENPRKEGLLPGVVDHDPLEARPQAEQDAAYEVVRQGPVPLDAVERHLDRVPDEVVHVDHERLLVVAQEHGAAVGGGHHSLDGGGDYVVLHWLVSLAANPTNLTPARAKGKRREWRGARRDRKSTRLNSSHQ